MADVKTAQILEILRQIKDPDRKIVIVSLNMVSGIVSKDGNIGFTIDLARTPNGKKNRPHQNQ